MTTGPARRWLSILLAEASGGVTLVTGLLTVSSALLFSFLLDTSDLASGLADPANVALTACLFLGSVAAGGAALRSGLLVRQGVLSLADSTPRGRFGVLVITSVALSGWAVLGYGAFLAVTLISADLGGPATWGMTVLVVQAVALLLACTVAGMAAGLLWANALAAPVVAMALFVGLNVLDLTGGWLGRLSPVYGDIFYSHRLEPNALLLTGVTLSLLVATLVMVAIAFSPRRLVRLGLLGVAAVVGGGAALALSAAPPGDTVQAAHDQTGLVAEVLDPGSVDQESP